MSSPLIIALTGAPGAGKDSAATVLVNRMAFMTIAFADALRREICATWRIDERMLTNRATKELAVPALAIGNCGDPAFTRWAYDGAMSLHTPRSARWVMQHWGDFQRRYKPSYYADIVTHWMERYAAQGFTRFAVTDLRYPIELEALRRVSPSDRLHVVRIHRQQTARLPDETAGHNSERAATALPANFHVSNDDTLASLAADMLALPPLQGLQPLGTGETA
ncbi:hypothetical protein AZ34_12020 [Hylemonella gracilis str. Niagara R]|uniref:Deoxynucleotide monophosphate kinase n=1 Tax=Hylemonella gracilis str. Niagara R TaxID=1458275 RepID=A0A016XLW8_9BURK|nr:hypothetical protein [Hylemonella gracilis]EYC52900.1 hypothetical protein AZ34_12020 [Hylemonella gracilis str. Niagara R]